MTCQELTDFLADYLAHELPEAQRREFDHHLTLCPDCVNYLDGYKQSIRLGREALCDGAAIPHDVPEDLVQAVMKARGSR